MNSEDGGPPSDATSSPSGPASKLDKLQTLTNLRVIRDEDSPTGWKLSHDPFPGWETVPTW